MGGLKQLTVKTSCRSSGPDRFTMVRQTTDGTALLAAPAQLPGGAGWCPSTTLLLPPIRGADSSTGTAAAVPAPPSCRIGLLLLMCVWPDKHRVQSSEERGERYRQAAVWSLLFSPSWLPP